MGDPVAMVIAESRYIAEDGCELVEVDYDDLPPVVTAAFALDPSSPPLFANLGNNIARAHSRNEFGDVPGTFAGADRVLDFHIDVHRHQNVPMEGRGCVASWDADLGEMTFHAATQSVHITRNGVAARLGLEGDKVRVLAGDIGGSFGLKIGASREELAVAAASKHLSRPVKWIEDRGENLTVSGQAREESFDIRAAVSNDGDLLGLDVQMIIDTGAYPGMGTMVPDIMQAMLPGPYKLAAMGFESTAAITNKASYVAYRGPWASETFIRERVLNLIAKDLGLDPFEIRMRNVAPLHQPARPDDHRPSAGGGHDQRVTGAGGPAGGLPGLPAPAGRGPAAGPLPRRRRGDVHRSRSGPAPGEGTAAWAVSPCACAWRKTASSRCSRARCRTGRAIRRRWPRSPPTSSACRSSRSGSSSATADVVPFGLTGGSRSATMTGGVALHGARDLKAKVLDFAAGLMEASPQDLLITDGNVWVQGDPDSAMAVSEVARRAASGQFEAGVGVELEVVATYDGGQGGWSGGTHAAIVDVDVETGIVKVERYIAVEDCGALINPAIVEGQIRGGVAQGIGAVLLERSVYAEDGNYVSATFMDYLMPTACDVPRIEIEHLRDGAARRRRQLPRRGRRRHDRGAAHAGERH